MMEMDELRGALNLVRMRYNIDISYIIYNIYRIAIAPRHPTQPLELVVSRVPCGLCRRHTTGLAVFFKHIRDIKM